MEGNKSQSINLSVVLTNIICISKHQSFGSPHKYHLLKATDTNSMSPSPVFSSDHSNSCDIDLSRNPENDGSSSSASRPSNDIEEEVRLVMTGTLSDVQGTSKGPAKLSHDGKNDRMIRIISEALKIIDAGDVVN
jgi:hypothetical protein